MAKGESTRQRIVEQAAETASLTGIESLTIGVLADRLSMSKSGLFAHFGSRETLQLATIDAIVARFTSEVVERAAASAPGGERLLALCLGWLDWSVGDGRPGGCPLAAAAFEFDAQPGAPKERLSAAFLLWERVLKREARLAGLDADEQHRLVFAIFGVYFAHHLQRWLLGRTDATSRARDEMRRIVDDALGPPSRHALAVR